MAGKDGRTRGDALNKKMNKFEKTLDELKDINNKNHTENLENYKKIQSDINNMKDVIIQNLINENKKLQNKIKNLEKKNINRYRVKQPIRQT